MHHTLNARTFAAGWLNVALAAGDDPEGPTAQYRTVLIETHPHGVRLISCDGRMLFHTWVGDPDLEPGLDEAPIEEFLAADIDQRMRALAGWLLTITAPKKEPWREVTVADRSLETDQAPTLSPELDRRGITVDADIELVTLPVVDADPVNWRNIIAKVNDRATKQVTFGLDGLARLGKMRCVDGGLVTLRFAGKSGAAGVVVETVPPVRGVLMPVTVVEDIPT